MYFCFCFVFWVLWRPCFFLIDICRFQAPLPLKSEYNMEGLQMDEIFCLLLYMRTEKERFILLMFYLQRNFGSTSKDSTRKTLTVRYQQILVYPVTGSLRGDFEAYMNQGQVNTQTIMRFEAMRIKSFHNIQIHISSIRLANAGFYATGDRDEVRCFSCGSRRSNWRRGDNPCDQTHHRQNCRHAQRIDGTNVEFRDNPLPYDWASRRIQQVIQHETHRGDIYRRVEDDPHIRYWGDLGTYQHLRVIRNHSGSGTTKETPSTSTTSRRGREIQGQTQGFDVSEARHHNHRDIYTRIGSFRGSQHTLDPLILALSGFFSAGYKDCLRCFYCGVGLLNWEEHYCPWFEHVRHSPTCAYLQMMAGQTFIQNIQNNISSNQNMIVINTSSQQSVDIQQQIEDLNDQLKISQRQLQILKRLNSSSEGDEDTVNELKRHVREAIRELCKKVTRLHAALSSNTREEVSRYLREIELLIQLLEESVSEARKHIANTGVREQQDNERIRQENKDMKNSSKCKVCLENAVNIVLLPCGHLVTCAQCAPALTMCPVCRREIRGTVKVYLST